VYSSARINRIEGIWEHMLYALWNGPVPGKRAAIVREAEAACHAESKEAGM
jgi:hypothetical protein